MQYEKNMKDFFDPAVPIPTLIKLFLFIFLCVIHFWNRNLAWGTTFEWARANKLLGTWQTN